MAEKLYQQEVTPKKPETKNFGDAFEGTLHEEMKVVNLEADKGDKYVGEELARLHKEIADMKDFEIPTFETDEDLMKEVLRAPVMPPEKKKKKTFMGFIKNLLGL